MSKSVAPFDASGGAFRSVRPVGERGLYGDSPGVATLQIKVFAISVTLSEKRFLTEA
jgi:hypothetical protein